ncbi:MAG: hypothetical protein RhofKO_06360 [Rhodothermales bacterium]
MPAGLAPEQRAAQHLAFIRETMAQSATFTAVPGWGVVAMGAIGLVGMGYDLMTPHFSTLAWLLTAVVAATVGAIALHRKAVRAGVPLGSGAGRKYVLGLVPALLAGACLTWAIGRLPEPAYAAATVNLLPGLWLLLYGVAMVTAGMFSVPVIPAIGTGFMALAVVAFLVPPVWQVLLLGVGFGGLHLFLGCYIVRRYGR